ncbi:MAG: hypothetical protein Q9228_002068 [Teloschistes exilis]
MSSSARHTRRPGLAQGNELPEAQVTPTTRRVLRSENATETSSYRYSDDDEDDLEESPVTRRPRGRLALLSPEPSSGSEWNTSDDESEADEPLVNSDDEHFQQHDLNNMDQYLEDEMTDLLHLDAELPSGSQSKGPAKGHAQRHPNAPKISKLQEKIARKREAGLNVTDSGRKRGVTQMKNGQLEYLLKGEWVKAIHHAKIREYLLKFTDEMGQYAIEPCEGADPWDRTAFHPDHAEVRLSPREVRPDCLFQWTVPDSLEDSMPEPRLWYHYGHLVLDVDDRPVRTFKELPLTLSGQCEGLRMEFYRRMNPRIGGPDLRARMPDRSRCGPRAIAKRMKGPALANRMARDRYKIGLRAMYARNESLTKEMAMFELIPPHIQREIVRTNSTRCFRDLTLLEFQYIEGTNKGTEKSLNKASTRRLTDLERRDRVAKQQKYLKKGSLTTYPVIPEIMRQRSDWYGPGRRLRKAAASGSKVARRQTPALDDAEVEEGLEEEDYDQEEPMLAIPDQAEEQSEVSDLPPRGPLRKRRRISVGEEERRTAILAQAENRLGSWGDNSPAPATHRRMPSTRIEHAEGESFRGLHTDFEGYRGRPFDHFTREYGTNSSVARRPQPTFRQDSYWPQIHERQIGEQAPSPALYAAAPDGFAARSSPISPFTRFNNTTAGLGVPGNRLGGRDPMQELTGTAQTPQVALEDTSVEQTSELFGEDDMIDWDRYERAQ